jgi:hypothetical protein
MGTVPDTAKEPPPEASEKMRTDPYMHNGPELHVAVVDVAVAVVVASPAAATASREPVVGPA